MSLSSLSTPYQKLFGNYLGPFFVESIDPGGVSLDSGDVVYLEWDDRTSCPKFTTKCGRVGYLYLKEIQKMDIKSQEGLELYCMLYPQYTEIFTNYFCESKTQSEGGYSA